MYFTTDFVTCVYFQSFAAPGPLGSISNGYALGLPTSTKDPTWTFKDTLIYNGQHQQVIQTLKKGDCFSSRLPLNQFQVAE